MIVGYYAADIPGGRSRDCLKMHIEVGSPGGTVTLYMGRADGKAPSCQTEMTVAETKKLIEGLLDALTGRCNMTFEQRNCFCKAPEIHPKPTRRGNAACRRDPVGHPEAPGSRLI